MVTELDKVEEEKRIAFLNFRNFLRDNPKFFIFIMEALRLNSHFTCEPHEAIFREGNRDTLKKIKDLTLHYTNKEA